MAETSKKNWLQRIKSIKHLEVIIAVVAVAVMLLLYFSAKAATGKDSPENSGTDYCSQMEIRLENTLSKMQGVGKAKILVHWEFPCPDKPASGSWGGSSDSEPKPYPKALGIVIICQGGNDVKTRLNITNAVSVLFDITPEKIIVYAMSKS